MPITKPKPKTLVKPKPLTPFEQVKLEALIRHVADDEIRARCRGRGGLLNFMREFWHIVEPSRPMVEGWVLQAICSHLEAVTFGEINRLSINVPPGSTKALDDDTPILTTWGWKRHGDLMPGDFVFGADGKPKRVLGVTPPAIKPVYEAQFDDGASIVAAGDHLWAVERDVMSVAPKYTRGRRAMVVETSDLQITRPEEGWARRPDRIAVCEPVEMPPKRFLVDPYILGLWLGDGTTDQGSISASHEDIEHFLQLGATIGTTYPAEGTRKQPFYRLNIEGLTTKLRVMGMLGNKHIPDDYLEASVEQRWELLRGLMDTDGCATEQGNCTYVTKLPVLGRQILTLACSLGLKATLRETWNTLDGVRFGPYQVIAFTPPQGAVLFKLKRKQDRVRGAMNARSRHRYVKAVTELPPRSVRCIQVEGEMYLAGKAFVPTHNSLTADVFWPAWEWGPMNMPSNRYMCASYNNHLTVRDNRRFRRLIMSPEYQRLWGKVFGPAQDAFNVILVGNDKTGWKLATSIGGTGTGERADRVVCLPYGEKVLTSDGYLAIGDIVKWNLPVRVAGHDGEKIVWQRITQYQRNPAGKLVQIETATSVLTLTERHRVYVPGGKTEARDLQPGNGVHVMALDGSFITETVSRVERLDAAPPETFNLTVEPCHNYFANGILVANCDDGNNPLESESELIMETTRLWFTEVIPDRLNHLEESAIINIQQRTNEGDISGIIMELELPYTHLIIPMSYDPRRHCSTSIGWEDPRGLDENGNLLDDAEREKRAGTLAWPERFSSNALADLYKAKGPYAVSGQYQQLPTPRGGGLFQREWIEPWPRDVDGSFPSDMIDPRGRIKLPALEYVCGWVDTAMTEKQENDFSAMVVVGIFRAEGKGTIVPNGDGTFKRVADDYGFPKAIVIYSWQKRLTIHGPPQEPPPGMSEAEWNSPKYLEARRAKWGLVEWVADTCRRYKVDYLGIETQALGHTLQQELARLHGDLGCAVELVPARGDKVTRAYAVQGLFSSRQVYFPTFEDGTHPTWLTPLADQLFVFPKGSHDDLVDGLTGGLRHLREIGIFERREEFSRVEEDSMRYEVNRPVPSPYDL